MKRFISLLVIPFFIHATPDVKQQLALYKKYKTKVKQSIQNPNYIKFEDSLKVCMGEKEECPRNAYPIMRPVLKVSDQFTEKIKILLQKQKNHDDVDLNKKRIKALQNFQERISAGKTQSIFNETHCTFGIHIWKLWDGIRYLGAAFGLWVLGTISYTGGMENINPVPTQEFIYNCLRMPHTIPIVLESGEKTALVLYGLCAAATCYGGKNIYDALLYKRNLKHNKKELENMAKLIEKKFSEKNQ